MSARTRGGKKRPVELPPDVIVPEYGASDAVRPSYGANAAFSGRVAQPIPLTRSRRFARAKRALHVLGWIVLCVAAFVAAAVLVVWLGGVLGRRPLKPASSSPTSLSASTSAASVAGVGILERAGCQP